MNFKAFRDKVFQLYNTGAYAEALTFINEHAAKFPTHGPDIYFWRACLSCRAGDEEAGLAWLQEASDQRYWYHESMLRDRDLSVLHDTGKLELLQTVFQQRHAAAQDAARPELKVWSPSGPRRGLVLFLHGAGGNITDEEENRRWEPAVAAGWQVAFAQSSQVWGPGQFWWNDRELAVAEVRSHLDALQAPELTVLAGFSAGGALAVHMVLSGAAPATRFLAVAPAVRMDELAPVIETAPREAQGYVVVGERDWFRQQAVELAEAMQQAGLTCHLERHPDLDHDFPPNFSAQLVDRLAALTA